MRRQSRQGKRCHLFFLALFLLPLFLVPWRSSAAIAVKDDLGSTVTLARPASRIVTLAPHTMELVCAAGGCDRIVGKGSHSFYPPQSRLIPEIGDNRQMDIERVLSLKPDLVVVWRHGLSERQVDQLRQFGIPVFVSDPRRLEDIPGSMMRLGSLMGTSSVATRESRQLRESLSMLQARYAQRPRVRVFYQVSDRPLYTLNGRHIISEAIRLCGGENVFASLKTLAPQISVEAVLQADPDIIIHTSVDTESDGPGFWKRYPVLKAVRERQLYSLNPDLLDRPGPRLIAGVKAMCETMDRARQDTVRPRR